MNLSRQRTFMTFHIKNMSITEQQDVVNFSSLKEFRSFTFATEWQKKLHEQKTKVYMTCLVMGALSLAVLGMSNNSQQEIVQCLS